MDGGNVAEVDPRTRADPDRNALEILDLLFETFDVGFATLPKISLAPKVPQLTRFGIRYLSLSLSIEQPRGRLKIHILQMDDRPFGWAFLRVLCDLLLPGL